MAITNLQFNVQANTARALADFKKFSSSLDNKFLVSGLKLDVIRSSLSQINREFQKSIGEQGMASASSLRAAQNQAALLTQTFKGFAADSASAINRDIGTALNNLAVRAGGTMKDVQKTLAATPFISTQIGADLQKQLTEGMMKFQTSSRQAGVGDSSDIFKQLLSGSVTGRELVNSLDPLSSLIGAEVIKRSQGQDQLYSAKARSELVASIVGDEKIQAQMKEMAKKAMGYRLILEELNTKLFNTESGVFGSLRKVVDKAGKSTTVFDEVYKLVEQVFGPSGTFKTFFSRVSEVFGIGDPLRPFIEAIRFVTKKFEELAVFFKSDQFTGILGVAKNIFSRISETFNSLFRFISEGGLRPENLTQSIRDIGKNIREFIENVGAKIRGEDFSSGDGFFADVAATLFEEIGKTSVTLIKELFATLIDRVPEIASQLLPALNNGINEILTQAFGTTGAAIVKFIAGFIPGPIGMLARASAVGDVTGGGGSAASMLMMGAGALLAPGAIRATGGFARDRFLATRQHLGGFALPFRSLFGGGGGGWPFGGGGGSSPRSGGGWPFGVGGGGWPFGGGGGSSPGGGGSSAFGRNPFQSSGYGWQRHNFSRNYTQFGGQTINLTPGPGGAYGIKPPPISSGYGWQRHNFSGNYAQFGGQTIDLTPGPGGAYGINTPPVSSGYGWQRHNFSGNYSQLGGQTIDLNRMYNGSYGVQGYSREIARQRLENIRAIRARKMEFRSGVAGLTGGLLAGGGALLGGAMGGETGNKITALSSVLGGGLSGAATGAQMGMILGPKGAAIGAVLGAVIGGAAPLMDKGVRDGIGTFVQGMGDSLKSLGSGILTSVTELFNGLFNALGSLPKMAGGVMQAIYNLMPEPIKQGMGFLNTVWGGVTGFVSRLNISSPFYAGKDFAGPAMAMAMERKMSGRQPLVVNDGEFVIPSNGFATLSGLVSNNLRATGVTDPGGNQPVQVNINLTVQSTSVVADASELASALRGPVYQIIDEAWKEATQTNVRRARTA